MKQCPFGKPGGRPVRHPIALLHFNTSRAHLKEILPTRNRLQWDWGPRGSYCYVCEHNAPHDCHQCRLVQMLSNNLVQAGQQ